MNSRFLSTLSLKLGEGGKDADVITCLTTYQVTNILGSSVYWGEPSCSLTPF